ncbi:glutamate racemase [Kitasatospora phosalacinea]|uniref:Glutamate racemase n=1 Tax=Kitasatospora phosalacinea TaxID=2065 RepID=A0A9W6QDB4_9ACTN|nr:glutamate racemase [Kitasatospora phosalacinea]
MLVKIALVDSGIGLLAAAAAIRRARPDADLVVSCDPDGMPWGPRTPEDITAHALACARAAVEHRPEALVVACNTATVHALARLRTEFEPGLPVIGTVPAIKPAAAAGGVVAIWATSRTTGSAYQRGLITEFGGGAEVHEVACPGLAEAVERADEAAIAAAVASAAARTPAGTTDVVLGCTHYELIDDRIAAALTGPVRLHGSADAIAAQTLRRLDPGTPPGGGTLTVLHSGRPSALQAEALAYPQGALLTAARV